MTILLTALAWLIAAASPAPAGGGGAVDRPRVRSATYRGGSGDDSGLVARAPDGSVYLAGTTTSRDLPVKRPPTRSGGRRSDVWIAKLSPDGRVRWSTHIGGGGLDSLADVAVDGTGAVLLVGSTNSPDFPVEDAISEELGGDKDAFVTKLDPDGAIVFSTYLGASEGDHATAVVADASGSVYVHGYTFSYDFPTTPGALKAETAEDSQDATLVKLTPDGEVVYSTRLGGETGGELGYDVAVTATGSAYVSGWTDSDDFPTVSAAQDSNAGTYDAYVARVDPSGTSLEVSTYLGGDGLEGGGFLATTGDGVAVALITYSRALTTTGFQPRRGGGRSDVYLARYASDGSLEAASFLGGGGSENVTGLAAGAAGELYVIGSTGSKDFPVRAPFQRRFGGRSDDDPYLADAFVTRAAADLSAVTWSSFLGGSRDDGAAGVAAFDAGLWVSGVTYSRDFPTRHAIDRTWNGASDAWLARIAG